MTCHRCHERPVGNNKTSGSNGQSERDIQGVVGGVTDGHADLKGDVMQAHVPGGCRWNLRPQEFKALLGLVRAEQLAAYLQPQHVRRLI